MKTCKYCHGGGTQGIGQDFGECVECGGFGVRHSWREVLGVIAASFALGVVFGSLLH